MLDMLNALLIDTLGPAGPLIAVAGLALLLILAAAPMLLSAKPDPMDRLKNKEQRAAEESTRAVLRERGRNERLNRYKQFLEPQDAQELSEVRMKLLQAGYRSRDSVQIFYLAQMVLGVGLLAAGASYYFLFVNGPDATMQSKIMWMLIPGAAGYMAPKYWITRRVAERREQIQQGFPDALDMMLVCVEAGQSLDQSINRVAVELRAAYPMLADEFQIVSHEMKAGKERGMVLNDMGERCGVQDISSFVTVMNQAQKFGTSISDALRVYASEMRDKRVMRAEEKANQLPTKMTLTTMMLTVPPLLLILVGPSAISITQIGSLASQTGLN